MNKFANDARNYKDTRLLSSIQTVDIEEETKYLNIQKMEKHFARETRKYNKLRKRALADRSTASDLEDD